MIQYLQGLRMKQQALIIQGTIIFLALLIIVIIVLPKSVYEIEVIKSSSHNALIQTNDAKVSQLSQRIKTLIDYAFLQSNLTLIKAQQIYLKNVISFYEIKLGFSKQENNKYIMAFQQPQSQDTTNYTISQHKQYFNFLGQLEQFLLAFYLEYQSNLQIIARIQKPHIASSFSFLQAPKTFNIETRPYYIEHMKQNQSRIIGSPFLSLSTSKLSFVVSQTIHNQNKSKDGIMIIGFQLDNLIQYLSLNNIKFVLCTFSGIIVASNINNTQQIISSNELYYIYNQTLFPFTQDDWDQMNYYIQNQSYQSNCRQAYIKFCRNMDGNDIQIEAQYIQNKFISIIFNELSFTKLEDQILSNNIDKLLVSAILYGIVYLVWCLIILIFSTIIMTRIIKPTAEMIYIVELQINTSSLDQKEYSLEQLQYGPEIFSKLQSSIIQLIQRQKNYRQKKIEILNQQTYPKFNQNAVLRTQGMIEQIINIPISINKRQSLFRSNSNQNFSKQNNSLLLKIDKIIYKN